MNTPSPCIWPCRIPPSSAFFCFVRHAQALRPKCIIAHTGTKTYEYTREEESHVLTSSFFCLNDHSADLALGFKLSIPQDLLQKTSDSGIRFALLTNLQTKHAAPMQLIQSHSRMITATVMTCCSSSEGNSVFSLGLGPMKIIFSESDSTT